MYFLAYEFLVQREMENSGKTRKEMSLGSSIFYGAMAGYAMWLSYVSLLSSTFHISSQTLKSFSSTTAIIH